MTCQRNALLVELTQRTAKLLAANPWMSGEEIAASLEGSSRELPWADVPEYDAALPGGGRVWSLVTRTGLRELIPVTDLSSAASAAASVVLSRAASREDHKTEVLSTGAMRQLLGAHPGGAEFFDSWKKTGKLPALRDQLATGVASVIDEITALDGDRIASVFFGHPEIRPLVDAVPDGRVVTLKSAQTVLMHLGDSRDVIEQALSLWCVSNGAQAANDELNRKGAGATVRVFYVPSNRGANDNPTFTDLHAALVAFQSSRGGPWYEMDHGVAWKDTSAARFADALVHMTGPRSTYARREEYVPGAGEIVRAALREAFRVLRIPNALESAETCLEWLTARLGGVEVNETLLDGQPKELYDLVSAALPSDPGEPARRGWPTVAQAPAGHVDGLPAKVADLLPWLFDQWVDRRGRGFLPRPDDIVTEHGPYALDWLEKLVGERWAVYIQRVAVAWDLEVRDTRTKVHRNGMTVVTAAFGDQIAEGSDQEEFPVDAYVSRKWGRRRGRVDFKLVDVLSALELWFEFDGHYHTDSRNGDRYLDTQLRDRFRCHHLAARRGDGVDAALVALDYKLLESRHAKKLAANLNAAVSECVADGYRWMWLRSAGSSHVRASNFRRRDLVVLDQWVEHGFEVVAAKMAPVA